MNTSPLSKITTNNQYLRLDSDVETLVKSIEAIGLINPLTINKRNELLAGGRRYSAIKELGWKDVPVLVIDRSVEEQELISIDENIVRKALDKLELENAFNRGREIYEEINPEAIKIEIKVKDLTPEEKRQQKHEEDLDETSFAAITAQKTGLSKSVIKSAIRRDELSSNKIKKARSNGELSASQVNEIVKLSKKDQEKILPHVQDKTVKDVRRIITELKKSGIDQAIDFSQDMNTAPREITDLIKSTKKINKALSKLVIEEIAFEGKEMDTLDKELYLLKNLLGDYLDGGSVPTSGYSSTEESVSIQ